jgi:hypothetical protein
MSYRYTFALYGYRVLKSGKIKSLKHLEAYFYASMNSIVKDLILGREVSDQSIEEDV